MSKIENGRKYRWDSPREWYDENDITTTQQELLAWLFENGYVNNDMLQECFQTEMTDDGFFFGNPIAPDWPLTEREGIDNPAECKGGCGNEFYQPEVEAMENGVQDFDQIDDLECDNDECPVKRWCDSHRNVQ